MEIRGDVGPSLLCRGSRPQSSFNNYAPGGPLLNKPPLIWGPNPVPPPPLPEELQKSTAGPTYPSPRTYPRSDSKLHHLPFSLSLTGPSLFCLVEATCQVLNISKPEVTQSCWLCLDSRPPFYDSIALPANFSTETDSSKCRWSQENFECAPRVTLQALTGTLCCHQPTASLPSLM